MDSQTQHHQGQDFASVATIRAAIFDVVDAQEFCLWVDDDDSFSKSQKEDFENAGRLYFVDAVIKRIAELQAPPHDGIKLENLCPRHRREALPVPTANICVMCESERKVK